MEHLSITTTAVHRSDIIEKTYQTLTSNISGIDYKKLTLYINVDPLPPQNLNQKDEIKKVCEFFFGKVVINFPETPSFAKAVKWCWQQVDSEYVFHIEDDWKFLEKININDYLKLFNDTVYQVAFRAYPGKYNKMVLSPSLLKNEVCKKISENLDETINPEVQLRGKKFGLNMPIGDKPTDKIICPSKQINISDMGRKWLASTKYRKSDKHGKSHFNSWIEK
jgi:hypothetical protein